MKSSFMWIRIAHFRNYYKRSFGGVSKYIYNYLKSLLIFFSLFELLICVKLNFPHTLQPNQQTATAWKQEAILESSYFPIKSDSKEICKNIEMLLFPPIIFILENIISWLVINNFLNFSFNFQYGKNKLL